MFLHESDYKQAIKIKQAKDGSDTTMTLQIPSNKNAPFFFILDYVIEYHTQVLILFFFSVLVRQ